MILGGLFLGLHGFFTADNITGIHTPADLIHCDHQTTHTALIGIALVHPLLRHFFCGLLDCHRFLLSLD